MSRNASAYVLGATNITVGLSATTKFMPPAGMLNGEFRIVSGAGTLAISGETLVGSDGYKCPTTPVAIDGPAQFYFGASGAAMEVSILIRGSAGATLG